MTALRSLEERTVAVAGLTDHDLDPRPPAALPRTHRTGSPASYSDAELDNASRSAFLAFESLSDIIGVLMTLLLTPRPSSSAAPVPLALQFTRIKPLLVRSVVRRFRSLCVECIAHVDELWLRKTAPHDEMRFYAAVTPKQKLDDHQTRWPLKPLPAVTPDADAVSLSAWVTHHLSADITTEAHFAVPTTCVLLGCVPEVIATHLHNVRLAAADSMDLVRSIVLIR